jgi:hypothetical protein
MWENYSGNNPNKFSTEIKDAGAKFREIEGHLKNSGVLERTPKEQLDHQLDVLYPNAQSREIVAFNERKYMRRFTPASKSLSGKTVKEWHRSWEEME